MIEVPNWDVFIPYISDKNIKVKVPQTSIPRGESRGFILLNNETTAALPFVPMNPYWVQVFDETGFALVNPYIGAVLGGAVFETYNIVDNMIVFSTPRTGRFMVVCDQKPYHDPSALVIPIKNVQGSLSAKASLFVEPIIMTEPSFGYARLSEDRKSIVYKQTDLSATQDSFSYCLINNHGQYSNNACIYLTFEA